MSHELYYNLDENNNVVPCSWDEWVSLYDGSLGKECRRIARDEIDGKLISTVFLGLDHNWGGGAPLVFETMVFGSASEDIYMTRYSTYKEAEEGHAIAVQWVNDGCKECCKDDN